MTTPLHSADTQLAALLHSVGIAALDGTGWIRVTGADRVRWLNGMVTNSIQQLASGEGCYSFALNAQGRILGDLNAFVLADCILLETGRAQIETLFAHFDRFIIMDEVELADVSDERAGLVLAGPQAEAILGKLDLATVSHSPLRLQSAVWQSEPLEIIHAHSPLVPRIELWAAPATIQRLAADLIATGAAPVDCAALEQLRILEGTPRYGTDIRNSETTHDLPQETAQSRALHFTKGCYLGQEIVERIRSRGNVHRTFTGFALTGPLPTAGTVLESEAKSVGELTSVASIPLAATDCGAMAASGQCVPLQLALGSIRREALDRNLMLTYPGGTATPIDLPYAIH